MSRRRATAVVVLALAAAVPLSLTAGQWAPRLLGAVALGPLGSALPPPSTEAASAPLGTPAPLATPSDSYAFLATQPDGVTPVAYDPCRPIHYVVRPDHEPTGARELLTEAFVELSRVTGLVFVDDGPTTEPASDQRPDVSRELYGDRFAPVLVVWETAEENPDLATDVLGQAGSTWVSRGPDDAGVYVTGQVRLDAAEFTELLASGGGNRLARNALLHELAHLVGLDHVEDPGQLMYPMASLALPGFSSGDLTGLAALGTGRCFPEL